MRVWTVSARELLTVRVRNWNDRHWEGVRTVCWRWYNEIDDGVAAAGAGGSQKQVPSY